MKTHGGKRKGAGRKPMDAPPEPHGIRCTPHGWTWLQAQATGKGHSSVGKWADARGKKKGADA